MRFSNAREEHVFSVFGCEVDVPKAVRLHEFQIVHLHELVLAVHVRHLLHHGVSFGLGAEPESTQGLGVEAKYAPSKPETLRTHEVRKLHGAASERDNVDMLPPAKAPLPDNIKKGSSAKSLTTIAFP
jgi:hypothetical protein